MVVVGAGHNGLVAAAYLAMAGRRVLVLERHGHVGGLAVSAAESPPLKSLQGPSDQAADAVAINGAGHEGVPCLPVHGEFVGMGEGE
nr:NAD(P)-binding protein [Sinosporangium album]